MNPFPGSLTFSVATRPAMKRTSTVLLGALCAGLLLLPVHPSWAQSNAKPPTQMTYQGFLTDANGVPFGNSAPVNKTIIFRIYDGLTGGTLKWSSQQVVTVDKGYFSVLLGQGSAVGSEPFSTDLTGVFTGAGASDRYLELNADGTTIAPRLRFLPAPSAMLAKSATELLDPSSGAAAVTVNNGNVTVAGLTASGTITAANLTATGNLTANGTLTAASLSGSGANLTSLNASQITSGTLSAARLADLDASKITSGTLANARTTATSFNVANTIVGRDGAGNFSANIGTFGYANIGQVAQGFYSDSQNLALRPYPNGATFFQNSGGARTDMFIANNGNVGIGNTSPGSRLHVSGGDIQLSGGSFFMDNANIFYARNTSGSHEPFLWPRWADNIFYLNYGSGGFHIRNNSSATAMFMKDNGYVGIGTTSPDWPLTVQSDSSPYIVIKNSNGNYAAMGRGNGELILTLNNAGNGTRYARYDGDQNWDFLSDRRLKKDIVDLEPVLDRALKVQVRRYRWKEEGASAKHKLGVIAQEVQPLFPDLVDEMEDPMTKETMLTVGYGDFATIAVKALQEFKQLHDAEVSALKAQLADLSRENEKLQAANHERDERLAAIERFIADQNRTSAVQASAVRDVK